MTKLSYQVDEEFGHFLKQLRQQSPREWSWLIGKFRQRLVPWLKNKARGISSSLQSRDEFVEEVFEECLLKFYELFEEGCFSNYGDLEATIVTTSGYKLKEGFARLKKEQRWYYMEAEALAVVRERKWQEMDQQERQKLELIRSIKEQLSLLDPEESRLLVRYFNGEDLQDIATELSISAAACRKRKQRILEKLRAFVFKSLNFLIFWMI